MRDLLCDEFQNAVSETLIRHKSILDILTKYQEATARVNRAVAKAVTSCGCLRINAAKQELPANLSLQELRECLPSHLEGRLCDACAEALEQEIGNQLYFLAALCNVLDLNVFDILLKEHKKVSTLGVFNIS